MVMFKARRTIAGDYGVIQPGGTFQVEDWKARELALLEAKGVIVRCHAAPLARPVYQVQVIEPEPSGVQYEAKVIVPGRRVPSKHVRG